MASTGSSSCPGFKKTIFYCSREVIWEEKYIFSMKTNIEAEMAFRKFCWPVPKQR